MASVAGSDDEVFSKGNFHDQFAQATGLKINFHKSMVVPMHVPATSVDAMVAVLQCQQGAFPQTYLGLPLSNTKLRLSAFAPMIAKVDKYLAGWKATLLSPAGRVTLINAVLDGLPTYAIVAPEVTEPIVFIEYSSSYGSLVPWFPGPFKLTCNIQAVPSMFLR